MWGFSLTTLKFKVFSHFRAPSSAMGNNFSLIYLTNSFNHNQLSEAKGAAPAISTVLSCGAKCMSITHHYHCSIVLQDNLRQYVERIFNVITTSGMSCPTVMCDIFFSLRESAAKRFQGSVCCRSESLTCCWSFLVTEQCEGFRFPAIIVSSDLHHSAQFWSPRCM